LKLLNLLQQLLVLSLQSLHAIAEVAVGTRGVCRSLRRRRSLRLTWNLLCVAYCGYCQ
jgi:hypothetical protein